MKCTVCSVKPSVECDVGSVGSVGSLESVESVECEVCSVRCTV